jgi:GNAT superfamily N-acetyltransferase
MTRQRSGACTSRYGALRTGASYRRHTWLALSPAECAGEWHNVFADQSGRHFVFVADDEGDELIGFAAAGPERSGDPKYRGELYAVYVLPSQQRRGRALVRAVAGW